MIILDGSHAEGGGAILRTALALSIITNKPFRINNIRKNRPEQGLNFQHVKSIELAQKMCDAKVVGNLIGSKEVEFFPEIIKKGKKIEINIGTAGAISLALQAAILPCIESKQTFVLNLKGGTDVMWSPTIDYLEQVLFPIYRQYSKIIMKVLKRGYYPKGGGEVEVKISPREGIINPLNKNSTGKIIAIRGTINCSKDLKETNISERIIKGVNIHLSKYNVPINIRTNYSSSQNTGGSISLYSIQENSNNAEPDRVGASLIFEKIIDADKIAEEVSKQLICELDKNVPIDKYLCDQIIPLLAIYGGKIKTSEITKHTLSTIYVTEQFLGNILILDEYSNQIIRNLEN